MCGSEHRRERQRQRRRVELICDVGKLGRIATTEIIVIGMIEIEIVVTAIAKVSSGVSVEKLTADEVITVADRIEIQKVR